MAKAKRTKLVTAPEPELTVSTETPIEVETDTTIKGEVKFGTMEAIKLPSPKWTTTMFRTALYTLTFAGIAIIMMPDKRISSEMKLELVLYFNIGLLAVHMFSKMFGVDISKDTEDANSFKPNK